MDNNKSCERLDMDNLRKTFPSLVQAVHFRLLCILFLLSFGISLLFFLLSLKLLNIQFPKGFFRFVVNKRAIWTIAVIGVLAIWISIECFALPFFSNQAREEITQMHEPYRIVHPEIFKMIIQRSWQAIPLIFLAVLECMVFAPILEELFFHEFYWKP